MKGILATVAFGFILSGCSHLRMEEQFTAHAHDWILYGGNSERTNFSGESIDLPMTRLWEEDVAAGFGPSACAIADNILFVSNLQGEIHAIDALTGKSRGSYDFGSAVAGTPVIDGTLMYLPLAHERGSLVCYDLTNAKILWKAMLGDIESSPLLSGNRVIVTTLSGELACLEKFTGEIVWKYSLPANGKKPFIHSSPASDGSLVLFGSDRGTLTAVDLATGKLRWLREGDSPIFATPSITNGLVIVGSLGGKLAAYSIADGSVRWKRTVDGKFFGSQSIAGSSVLAGTTAGSVVCLDASTGDLRWTFQSSGPVSASVLVAGHSVVIGDLNKELSILNLETGAILWQYRLEGRMKTAPVAWMGRLYVFAEDHSVIAFGQEKTRE